MSDKLLVSSIIIFLNEEKYLEEAIESVFAQSYDNWELLLVDDGSTDGSTAISRRYAEKYPEKVRYLEHEGHQNRGMAASRNLGIRHAKGEYIAFLDGDDIWLPNKLTDQVPILESQPEAAMLYGRTQYWYSWTGNPEDLGRDRLSELGVELNRLVKPPTLLKLFLEDHDTTVSCCSLLIRREVFERVGWYEEEFRNHFSDMPFYTKLYLHEPVFVVDGWWDKYRHHPENSWAIAYKERQYYPEYRRFLNWVEQYLLEQGAKDTEVWWVLQKVLWSYRHPRLYRLLDRTRHPIRSMQNLLKKIGKRLPAPTHHWLRTQWHAYKHHPPLGKVNWGRLRRLQPISREWLARGQPVDRYYMERFFAHHTDDIRGRVLEIGDNHLSRKFGGDHVTKSDVLHVVEGNPIATIIGDLASADHIPSDSFDCFILTQTLQLIYDLPSALKTIHRILKPGGIVLATLSNITPLIDSDWNDCWYWNFTTLSAQRLFEEVFPTTNVQVKTYGNVMAATAFLQGLSAQELKPEELDYCDPSYQVLITVKAVKPEEKP